MCSLRKRARPAAESQDPVVDAQNSPDPAADAQNSPDPAADAQNSPGPAADAQNSPDPTADTQNSPDPAVDDPAADAQNSPDPAADAQNSPDPAADAQNSPDPAADAQNSSDPAADTQNSPDPAADAQNSSDPAADAQNSPDPAANGQYTQDSARDVQNSPDPAANGRYTQDSARDVQNSPDPAANGRSTQDSAGDVQNSLNPPTDTQDVQEAQNTAADTKDTVVDGQALNSETPVDNESAEAEHSENSESEEESVCSKQEEVDTLNTADIVNGSDDCEGEKENQCPDVVKRKEYRCKYCTFITLDLAHFKDHVDATHPDVILNPLYLCVVCSFRTKRFECLTEHNEREHPSDASFRFRKTRADGQTVLEQMIDEELPAENRITPTSPNSGEEICAVNINGTVLIPDPNALQDPSHVSPMLQRPPNFNRLPKIAVPLNTTKYNPSLDDNVTLITSFNKFPYPTHAELSWLTAASKHPEEQIRVWFTTQRLKQGITWSPEEVEEARKKMFNGSVPAAHAGTLTVLPTSPISKATVHTTTMEPPKFGQKRPVTVTAAGLGPEPKRPVMAVAPNPGERGLMALPALPLKPADAKWPPAMLSQKNKLAVNIPSNSKTRPLVSLPSMVFPESLTRPMIAPPPIFAPPFKNNILVPRANEKVPISLPNGTLPNSVPLISPQIRRPAIIQSVRGNPGAFPDTAPLKEQNGEGKWVEPCFQGNELSDDVKQQAQVLTQFPLLERMKGKTSEQLKVLEENFLRNSFPTHGDVESLASTTRLSPAEIDSWFSERRALRDNLEQALLNSMGTKRTNSHNGYSSNTHSANANNANSYSATIANGYNGNNYNANGYSANGYSANGYNNANGYNANGYSNNTQATTDRPLQNGVHKVGLGPICRGPDDSRWSFVEDFSRRWFGTEHINVKTGSAPISSEPIGPHCYDSTNARAQEAELNWFNKSLNATPSHERHDRVFGRWIDCRPDVSEES